VQHSKNINLFASFSPSPSILCKLVNIVPSSGIKRIVGTKTLHLQMGSFQYQVS
jgi:hypothetical protein